MPLCKRYHLTEINDQPWWPAILREKVQNCLTLSWITRIPIIQPTSPAALVSDILATGLKTRIAEYVYVDFASGAGGPTPFFEKALNATLQSQGEKPVKFVLTDIEPHVSAWTAAAKKSDHLSFVADSVDATNAPGRDLLLRHVSGISDRPKVMRLFSLAFHHFDDDLAANVLKNTMETSNGFCIFELVGRDISSMILVTLVWPLLMLQSWFFFFNDPIQIIFTYLIPWVPFVVQYDGYISALRFRTPEEVQALMASKVPREEIAKWKFQSGIKQHTWPLGNVHWIICTKEEE